MREHFLLVLLIMSLTACSDNDGIFEGQRTSSVHDVNIVSIDPPTSEILQVGLDYTITAEVSYSFNASEGEISLVIQRGESGHPPIYYTAHPISKGEGVIILKSEFTVPNTKSIQVFTPLTSQGDTSTSVVATRSYKAVDNRE